MAAAEAEAEAGVEEEEEDLFCVKIFVIALNPFLWLSLSGDSPSWSFVSTLAPWSTKRRTTLSFWFSTAKWSAVSPWLSLESGAALCCSIRSASGSEPIAEAAASSHTIWFGVWRTNQCTLLCRRTCMAKAGGENSKTNKQANKQTNACM